MTATSLWVGAPTSTGATVAAEITGTEARLAVSESPSMTAPVFFGPAVASPEGMVKLTATGLATGQRHYYAVEVDGIVDDRSDRIGQFRTIPAPGTQASFTLAATSCFQGKNWPGTGDLLSVPPADVRVSNAPVLDTIRAFGPDVLHNLGDWHYYNFGQFITPASVENYRRAYQDILAQTRQHALVRNIPTDYVHDDHDFGPNNANGTFVDKANCVQVHRERVPHFTLPDLGGAVYHSYEIGRGLVIVSDTRFYKSPQSDPDDASKTMLGADQKTWMETVLAASSAEFLVWMNPTPWMGYSSDTWGGYNTEAAELVTMFGDLGWLDRMVCIGGDSHALGLDSGVGNAAHTGIANSTFPVATFGSIDSIGYEQEVNQSHQYDQGPTLTGSDQWGTVEVLDHGFVIEITLTGRKNANVWRSYTHRVTTTTPFSTTFPATAAPWRVEIAPGGDPVDQFTWNWVDITDHVRIGTSDISIGYGRADEWDETSPTTCDLKVDNRDGRFSPRNPLGPWYPDLRQNTPIRVSWAGVLPRFTGYVSEWPLRWDQSGRNAYATIKAAGVMRRLSQGQKGLHSALRREFVAVDRIPALVYWPCEDGERAAVVSSAVDGAPSMRVAGAPEWGAYDDFLPSDPLPTLNKARFTGSVPSYAETGEFTLRMFVSVPEEGEATPGTSLFTLRTTGSIARWEIHYGSGGVLRVLTYDESGTEIYGRTSAFGMDGQPAMLNLALDETLGVVNYELRAFKFSPNGAEFEDVFISDPVTGTLGRVQSIVVGEDQVLEQTAVGHIIAGSDLALFTDTLDAMLAHIGERAADRVARLCTEEGLPVIVLGDSLESARMGPQRSGTLLELLRDAEAADGGVLYEYAGVLAYQSRSYRYNRPAGLTLAIDAGELAAPPEPTDDDQRLRNDVSAKRDGGAEVRVTDPVSVARVGRYNEQVTVNVERDEQLGDVAGWRVHLGTVDEMRWPSIELDLAHNPALISTWMQAQLGDRLTVAHALPQLPGADIDVLIEGWTETLNLYAWRVELNCAPASPWQVAVADADRIDTDGSALDADVISTDTELLVATTTTGPRWVEGEVEPLRLQLGGEHVDVAPDGIHGALTDTFTRVAADGWGTADTGQLWQLDGGAPAEYLVNGTVGEVNLDTIEDRRYTFAGDYSDVDIYAEISVPAVAVGGFISAGIVARWSDAANFYMANVFFDTDSSMFLQIFKRTDANFLSVAAGPVLFDYAAATLYPIRFRCIGDNLRAKLWRPGQSEPPAWTAVGRDIAHVRGAVGTHSNLNAGNVNVTPVAIRYDNYRVVNPQTMTVTRAVNGISKAHATGTDVRLANPAILAL